MTTPSTRSPDAATTGPRARGTRLPRSARRAQLLAAAQRVFVASGYHAAGMDEIAEGAGVSKPVLYQHFPGKRDLYLALLDQHGSALVDAVREALVATTDNKARVTATVEAYFAYVEREGEAFRLVFESDLVNEPPVRERVDSVNAACAAAIAEVIAEDTGLTPERAHLLGVALTGMAQVTARYRLQSGTGIERDEAARLVAQLSWRGLGGFPMAGHLGEDAGHDGGGQDSGGRRAGVADQATAD